MRNWNIFCAVLLVLFICSSNFSLIEAQDKIEGPWYWLIVDTSKKEMTARQHGWLWEQRRR